MKLVEERSVIVRDQAATLLITEGTSAARTTWRQASAVFEGKGGPAIVVYTAPAASCNQAKVETYINSIH